MATGGLHFGQVGQRASLIVNNLPDYFTEEELKSMFTTFGEVKAARICRHQTTNKSLGYGFVEYAKQKEAAKAIEEVNGLQLGKKKLRVAKSEPLGDSVKQASKVVVKSLPQRFDEQQIEEMFSKYGKIVKVRLLRDSVTNRSQRMAFVFFEKWADAQRAVTALHDFKPEKAKDPLNVRLDDDSLKPKTQWTQWQRASHQQSVPQPRGPHPYAVNRPHSQQSHGRTIPSVITQGPNPSCVFLYNIGEYVSEQEIYNLFAQFGGLKKIDIVRDMNTQLCKGYAFLTFDSYPAAENAILTMDGMFYRGRQLQVRFKYN